MLTIQELEYIKCLLPVYEKQGYINYVCHTVTNDYEDFDIYLYLSKDVIISENDNNFTFSNNSIVLRIDSSQRSENSYNPNINDATICNSFEGNLFLDVSEFVYTNANTTYSNITIPLNPDLNYANYDIKTNGTTFVLCCILTIFFLYQFITKILRLRK